MISDVEHQNTGWGSVRWSFTKEEVAKLKDMMDSYKRRGKSMAWLLADVLEMGIFKDPNTGPGFVARMIERVESGEQIFE